MKIGRYFFFSFLFSLSMNDRCCMKRGWREFVIDGNFHFDCLLKKKMSAIISDWRAEIIFNYLQLYCRIL